MFLGQYASALQVSPGCFRHNEHLRLLSGSVESYWCFGGLDLADKEGIFFLTLGRIDRPPTGIVILETALTFELLIGHQHVIYLRTRTYLNKL